MNEEILKAFTQLLSIVALQDAVITEQERNYVINLFRYELDPASLKKYIALFDKLSGYNYQSKKIEKAPKQKPLSIKDTVRTLAICNKINKSLEARQKLLLLLRILQLIAVDGNFSHHKKRIIETISAVFNISDEEKDIIEEFVFHRIGQEITNDELLIANGSQEKVDNGFKHIHFPISGEIIFLKLSSIDMYYVKYLGDEEIILNGFTMSSGNVYVFSNGSAIKTQMTTALYFSDLIRQYLVGIKKTQLAFVAENLEYSFPSGEIGLRNINIVEGPGKLIGIMGVSGAGKTTLLNTLSGIYKPSNGTVKINNINLHTTEGQLILKGSIGYIAQDDLLIEELTVFQNLYYNAKLCFGDLTDEEIRIKVDDILRSLGLLERKHMKVGGVLNKTLSGGQRKRLNIALELIREPSILFVDEPTSGLSSRDSENVMDLLKELTYKGKLIFVVIHQPNSDIYKLFDEIFILDKGGYPIYYGNPIEAIIHFKNATLQIDGKSGICPTCGNVNPDRIFNIIEERTVDELGNFTEKRKVQSHQWSELFLKEVKIRKIKNPQNPPVNDLSLPSKLKQILYFEKRDFFSKITDRQYLLLNLLEAPVLAIILAAIVRYNNSFDNTVYLFRFNENIPIYFMMSIIVALFLGLMVSAEEIMRDRKILKREEFLNLSWNSYLLSKVTILFIISAIQTLTFVIIGNLILEIKGVTLFFWLTLFSVSCFGNILGLNISHAFKSSVTVYILIPLLIIPQMILSGLLVNFDKINEIVGNKAKVPLIADLMTTRWAYEAIAVYQFLENDYEKSFYRFEQQESHAAYKSTFYYEKLKELVNEVRFLKNSENRKSSEPEIQKLNKWQTQKIKSNLLILKNELINEPLSKIVSDEIGNELDPDSFTEEVAEKYIKYLQDIRNLYRKRANNASDKRDKLIHIFETDSMHKRPLGYLKNTYFNESLADLVKNKSAITKVVVHKNRLYQLIDPIYNISYLKKSGLSYRSQFFVPLKQFFKIPFKTYTFNIMAIWAFTFFLYLLLYHGILRKTVNYYNK